MRNLLIVLFSVMFVMHTNAHDCNMIKKWSYDPPNAGEIIFESIDIFSNGPNENSFKVYVNPGNQLCAEVPAGTLVKGQKLIRCITKLRGTSAMIDLGGKMLHVCGNIMISGERVIKNQILRNFKVYVDDNLCLHYPGNFPDRETLACDKPVFGKTVKLTKPHPSHLQICDFIVKGSPGGKAYGPNACTIPGKSISNTGTCTLGIYESIDVPVIRASARQGPGSWPGAYGADKAVDNIHGGDWSTDRCATTMTGANPWWQVDMAQPSWVTGVTIQDRTDVPYNHILRNFKVYVDDNLCLHYPGNFPDRETLACDKPVFGKTIKLTKPHPSHLQICDFIVKGSPGGKAYGPNACTIP